jgi:hypothetical protein
MTTGHQKATSFLIQNLEAFVWITVITVFMFSPVETHTHFTICPLSLAGFEHCPGCGLGHSLILLLHGKWAESFRLHPLGILALAAFLVRIVTVFRKYAQFQKQTNYLKTNNN